MSNQPVIEPSAGFLPGTTTPGKRDTPIDYLRSYIIVNVVMVHSALAYASFSTIDRTQFLRATAPVVDTCQWVALDLFAPFVDTFIMPLMFFISGLFVFTGLDRKGSGGFFVARLKRLGIPFIFGLFLIIPLMYWPAYLIVDPEPEKPYLVLFFRNGGMSGHFWFLWVLLAFNGIVALTNRLAPSAIAKLRRRPSGLVVFLVAIVSFVSLNMFIPNYYWTGLGPFGLEPARICLYFAMFLLGTALGSGEEWRKPEWSKRWWLWFAVGGILLSINAMLMGTNARSESGELVIPPIFRILTGGISWLPESVIRVIISITWVAGGTGVSLGFLGLFRRLVRRPYRVLESLSSNSYGIYIIHCVFSVWIQYALLSAELPAWIKFSITFICTLALGWGASTLLRKIPAVRRVI
ncbi:MAG: acyltransferase family protein [Planctomycetota bacterium]|jgi:fucose 4-O-acetylase-like acetyltransferase